ncbi:NEW3 domain-containing protein [Castellaniella sp.]|uniref:COG1470 family protein n=1 Tax=Castellaniella sp. TaxID=1955812 RepID=UPI00355DF4C2
MMFKIPAAWIVVASAVFFQANALAATEAPPGIYLSTDYPALTLQSGQSSSIALTLRNQGVPPETLDLEVQGVPKAWKASLLGGGRPVESAMPASNQALSLKLQLEIPQQNPQSAYTLHVRADNPRYQLDLPIAIRLADRLPPQLSVQADLPQLTGSAHSAFDYQLKIKNDSDEDVLASLGAQVPQYFDASFTEGYGTQQVSAVPIKAGESKSVKLHVHPASGAASGRYDVAVQVAAAGVQASLPLKLDITGQPQLALAGRDGLLSTEAQIDQARTMSLTLRNSGSAVARDVELAATAPNGWVTRFAPDKVAALEPGKSAEVQLSLTPAAQSLAGDYMVKLQARAGGQSASSDLRVSVTTSSLWGVSGAVLIAIALLVLVGAVARYGRR